MGGEGLGCDQSEPGVSARSVNVPFAIKPTASSSPLDCHDASQIGRVPSPVDSSRGSHDRETKQLMIQLKDCLVARVGYTLAPD